MALIAECFTGHSIAEIIYESVVDGPSVTGNKTIGMLPKIWSRSVRKLRDAPGQIVNNIRAKEDYLFAGEIIVKPTRVRIQGYWCWCIEPESCNVELASGRAITHSEIIRRILSGSISQCCDGDRIHLCRRENCIQLSRS